MNSVSFHAEARAELVHEVGFYTAISRRIGERFDKAVKSAVNLAAEFPGLGSPYFFGTRRVFPKKFHFSIVYISIDTNVFIVAVAYDSRKPGYWRSRLSDG